MSANIRRVLWVSILVLAGGCATMDERRTSQLDAELRAVVEDAEHPLASLSVLAVRDGKVAYEGQFGMRHIATGKPANADTLYRVASISKFITTLGVMRLIEEGKLDLDADVGGYLGFAFRNPHFPDTPITLRMLMSHTSSLRDDGGYYWEARLGVHLKDVFMPGGPQYGKGAMWARNAAPGAYFQYANLPWGVIGTIMERVTGERFDRLMRRLVLDPLELRGGFHPADLSPADLDNVATLYRKRAEVDGKEIWNPQGPWVVQVDDYTSKPPALRATSDYVVGTNGTLFGPQGNCRLTAAGLGRVMRMLMNGGELDGKRFLQPATLDLMFSEQWRYEGRKSGTNGELEIPRRLFYAWGLGNQHFLDRTGKSQGDRLVEGGGFTAVGHLGDAWGLTAAFVFDRKSRNGLVFMTGGPGFDPATHRGHYSALYRHEERILTALYRRAVLGQTD